MSSADQPGDIKSKLRAEIMPALWRDLKPHAERNSLFIVDPELDLADVAVKVSTDDVTAIGAWIEGSKLARPTPEQLTTWNTQEGARVFQFVIVQPYVLIQEHAH